ncbi:MAG TPA: lysylphosphatidylglycerol synthase transmembrane domain-containing protein [Balneolaceae bacterium]|nr:lysylphosphatidylglycerol synthase transmembrane domain-containing protein [Balneolaceae bacterium]
MIKRISKFLGALALAGFFFWLAFRNVNIQQLWSYAKNISFWWLLPFAITMILSNVFRAERWRLLIEHEKKDLDHVTLIAGVFNGYFFNLIGPRFGEVSRPVYVARREDISPSKLIGTIVLERVIDVVTMMILMIITAVYLISDMGVLRQIFGDKAMNLISGNIPLMYVLWAFIAVLGLGILTYSGIKMIQFLASRIERVHYWVQKFKKALYNFKDGLLAVRQVERWGFFILYTILIWTCYVLMSYIPFWMFNMQHVYGLGILPAITITVVSSIGIAIPSPAGLGTYEYFVKQTLVLLFGVPAVTGLAYATVTHAVTILMVIIFTPITFAIDKRRQARSGAEPI